MRNIRDDFFSDPNWPSLQAPQAPERVRSKHSQKSSSNQDVPQKGAEFDQSFNIYITRDQYTIDAPSKFYQAKGESAEAQDLPQLLLQPFRQLNQVRPEIEEKQFTNVLPNQIQGEGQISQSIQLSDIQEDLSFAKDQLSNQDDDYSSAIKQLTCFKSKSVQKRPKYKILDKKVKRFLVKQTELMSIATVSKIFGVSINNITRWKKSCERKVGAGRKVTNTHLENRLISWIKTEISKNGGLYLSKSTIKLKAKQWSDNPDFKASKGWLQRFVNRNKCLKLHKLLRMPQRSIPIDCDQQESDVELQQKLVKEAYRRVSMRLKQKRYALQEKKQVSFEGSYSSQPLEE